MAKMHTGCRLMRAIWCGSPLRRRGGEKRAGYLMLLEVKFVCLSLNQKKPKNYLK